MKKYIRPEIIIFEIETSQLVAASMPGFCCQEEKINDPNLVEASGYRSNLWDD